MYVLKLRDLEKVLLTRIQTPASISTMQSVIPAPLLFPGFDVDAVICVPVTACNSQALYAYEFAGFLS